MIKIIPARSRRAGVVRACGLALMAAALLWISFPGPSLGGALEGGSMERAKAAQTLRAKWKADAADSLWKTDPELAEISDKLIYGEILANGSLTDKQKALVIMACLTASQGWDEIPQAARGALAVGAGPLEIREALYQCAPYAGLPRVKKALALANGEFIKAGAALPLEKAGTVTEETRFKDGLAVQKKIFGAKGIEDMQKNAPAGQQSLITNYLSAWCFGDFYTRGVLDIKTRELITFSAIVSLGGCNPQAQAHAKANLNVGNSPDDLIDALSVMLPFIGYPRTLNGLGCVNAVLAK